MNRIQMEPHPGHRDLRGTRIRSEQHTRTDFESLGLAGRGVVPLDDTLHSENLLYCSSDQITPHVHRHCQGLESRNRAETVDNHTRNPVALTPEDAANHRIDPERITELLCTLEAPTKKLRIQILTATGKPAGDDLGLGVVNSAAKHPVTAILDRDDVAILWSAKGLEHFGAVNPVVPVKNPGPWPYDDACHDVSR